MQDTYTGKEDTSTGVDARHLDIDDASTHIDAKQQSRDDASTGLGARHQDRDDVYTNKRQQYRDYARTDVHARQYYRNNANRNVHARQQAKATQEQASVRRCVKEEYRDRASKTMHMYSSSDQLANVFIFLSTIQFYRTLI